MDHPRPGLKYVTVDGLDESKTTLENFKVADSAGDRLGKLEGFIINTRQALPYSGFDLEKFAAMTAEELDRMATDIAEGCSPDEFIELDDLFEHFRTPIWWQVDYYKVEGFDQTPESVAGRKR